MSQAPVDVVGYPLRTLATTCTQAATEPVWQLGDRHVVDGPKVIAAAEATLAAARLRLVREAEARGLAKDAGAPSTGAWQAAALRTASGRAHRDVRTAAVLGDPVAADTASALAEGWSGRSTPT